MSTDNTPEEIWKAIPGYKNFYEVSDLGRVRRLKKSGFKILSPAISPYAVLNLCVEGKYYPVRVHQLVMLAFVGERPANCEINHINGIKTDNRLVNLEYVTHEQNLHHASETGLIRHSADDMTIESIRDLYAAHHGDITYARIARQLQVPSDTVRAVLQGKARHYKTGADLDATQNHKRYQKLSNSDVLEIKRLLATGMKQTDIAKQFGVNISSISRAKQR